MSYRELRNFTEIMRALGYPRLISMENFRRPNFELVADILYWMVRLYDPETTISDRVEFENERVEFLTGIANLLATKARLKLNTKKLYASDGRAVQELLKLASLLNKATKSVNIKSGLDDESVPPPVKVQDVKAARTLASEITQTGAKLYDLLAGEATERQERLRAIRFLDQAASASEGSREQSFIERSLRELIDSTKQTVEDMRKECEELEADERNIDAKIKKKTEELERTEKRLRSLENVRPQFMDEVEKLEKELQRHYDIYMEKYRNLDYLEHEIEKYHRNELERKEEQERRLKKMRERLLKEEVELLRGGRGGNDEDDGPKGRGPRSDSANRGGDSSYSNPGKGGGGGGLAVRGQAVQGPGPRSKVSGSMRHESDEGSSDGEDDASRGGDSDEELSVNSRALRGGSARGNSARGSSARSGSPRGRNGSGRNAAPVRGGRESSGNSSRPGRSAGGREPPPKNGGRRGGGGDSDEDDFLDDDDDDDDLGDDDGEDSGSDEHF